MIIIKIQFTMTGVSRQMYFFKIMGGLVPWVYIYTMQRTKVEFY